MTGLGLLAGKMMGFLVLSIWVFQGVYGKVFTPCELAQNIYETLRTKYGVGGFLYGNQEGLSLMVCIGGYHKFNSSSVVTAEDGLRREGIFGLIPPYNQTKEKSAAEVPNLTDDDIKDDVVFLVENVLYGWHDKKLVRNYVVYNFYEDLCDRFTAGVEIFCRISDYVVGNVPVLIPQDDSLLYGKCYQPRGGQGTLRRCQMDSLMNFDYGPGMFPPLMRTIGIRATMTLNSTERNSTDVKQMTTPLEGAPAKSQ